MNVTPKRLLIVALLAIASACHPAFALTDADLEQASQREASMNETRYGVVTDVAICGRLEAIFMRVARVSAPSRWPLRLSVLGNPQPNAFSLPDGRVFVNVGFLGLAPSDDELAFLLAHEIAHVCREHSRQILASAECGVSLAILNGFGRANEAQADADALAVMASAGFDGTSAIRLLSKMAAFEPRDGGAGDHPGSAERVRLLTALLRAHPEWTRAATAGGPAAQAPAMVPTAPPGASQIPVWSR